MRSIRDFFQIMLSFLFAWILMIVPMPFDWQWMRPQWLSLFVIYWIFTPIPYLGVLGAWCAGLALDMIGGSVLGQNALAMTVVAFLTYLIRLRSRQLAFWQQTLAVFFLVGAGQLILLLEQGLIGHSAKTSLFWFSTVISAGLWPLVFWSLGLYQRKILR